MTSTDTLSKCHVRHCYECRETRENVTCECSVHTPRRLQQIAISCKRSCYNKFKNMSSASFHSTATMRYWKKKTNATFGIDEQGLVQVALLQILGGDGS